MEKNMSNIIRLDSCSNERLLKGITINHLSMNDFMLSYGKNNNTNYYWDCYELPFYSDDDDNYWKNYYNNLNTNNNTFDDGYDEISYDEKEIYFYPDVYTEYSPKRFSSLKEFEIFCVQNNYKIFSSDYKTLMNHNIIHCCVDPIDLAYDNETNLICETSYSSLYWTVYDDIKKINGKNDVNLVF